jgi:hypothetical protein
MTVRVLALRNLIFYKVPAFQLHELYSARAAAYKAHNGEQPVVLKRMALMMSTESRARARISARRNRPRSPTSWSRAG